MKAMWVGITIITIIYLVIFICLYRIEGFKAALYIFGASILATVLIVIGAILITNNIL